MRAGTSRRDVLAGGATLALGMGACAQALQAGPPPDAAAPGADAFRRVPLDAVKLRDRLGQAIDVCMRGRIHGQDWRPLVDVFRTHTETRCWQTEFWGKWYTSAASAFEYTRDDALRKTLETSARSLMAAQSRDGYLGNYADDKHLAGWDIWGRKYTLLGLLAWHRISRDRAALASARRLADHLMSEVGPGSQDIVETGNYRGMPSSSILEPMILLHRATGEARYLHFARYIVSRWSDDRGPRLIEKALAGVPVAERFPRPAKWWGWENGLKAYEMMSCYEGLLELYRETGSADHLQAVVATARNIRDTEITITGSAASLECWFGGQRRQVHPARDTMETCVTTTWMKLCDNLLRLTGRPEYADEIERSAYNAMLGAMRPDGAAFCKYSPLDGFREVGPAQCDMGLHCCTANGPRGLMLLPQVAYMVGDEGPIVNLYGEGEARVSLGRGVDVNLMQRTTYPLGGDIRIAVAPSRQARFKVRLRIPGWAREASFQIGDGPRQPAVPGTYAVLEKVWQAGDEIRLHLDVRPRLEHAPDGSPHVAILRGPVVLARDSRLEMQGRDVDDAARPMADAQGIVAGEDVPGTSAVWMSQRVSDKDGHDKKALTLCDYASAGNAWNPSNRFRVWLREEYDPSAAPGG